MNIDELLQELTNNLLYEVNEYEKHKEYRKDYRSRLRYYFTLEEQLGLYVYNYYKGCISCKYWKSNYDYIVNKHIEEVKKDPKSNYNIIVNEVNRDGGKYIKFDNDDIGFLICATSTIEDYYYMYMDKDRNIKMSSCVGGYEIIESPETIQNLSVLSYIRKHDKMYIKEKITRYIKNLKYDNVITNIFY